MSHAVLKLRVLVAIGTHVPFTVALKRVAMRGRAMLGKPIVTQRVEQGLKHGHAVGSGEDLHVLIAGQNQQCLQQRAYRGMVQAVL